MLSYATVQLRTVGSSDRAGVTHRRRRTAYRLSDSCGRGLVHAMQEQPWWKDAVIYHIYPRSFYDANNDGYGDLNGITEKLSHIRELGATAIWMGPVFRSPQVDNGYDIEEYRDIDRRFGSVAEMERLIETAHGMGIRVLLDLVFNHSSDRHRWFTESKKSRDGEYSDYYIWRDPAEGGGPPNNWRSFFSVPAWTYVPERGQYYLHLFAPEQPDLNWENPKVRAELAEIANFWLEKGVDGFRMDVINVISKMPGLPPMIDGERRGLYIDGPKVLPYLQEFRSRLHRRDEIVLVGETPGITPEAARRYTDPDNNALDMVLIFDHVMLDHGPGGRWDPRPLEIPKLRRVVTNWQDALAAPAWPSSYLSNHDQPRVVSRYGDDRQYRRESATALATAFYLQRGTPIVYQGDEIAMANYPLRSVDDIVDIESGNAYRYLTKEKGVDPAEAFRRVAGNARDHGRTPMQWSAGKHGGFSGGAPWFPVNPDHTDWNVDEQRRHCSAGRRDAGSVTPVDEAHRSVFCYFRALFGLRRGWAALRRGEFTALSVPEESTLFVFERRLAAEADAGAGAGAPAERVVVVVNLSGARAVWSPPQGGLRPLLGNYGVDRGEIGPGMVELRPWEALILAL